MKPLLRERAQQMRAAGADHALDLAQLRRRRRGHGDRLRLRVLQLDGVQQCSHRRADRGPVRRRRRRGRAPSASRRPASRGAVVEFGKPGASQQWPQRRIAERGPVELGEMRVAAGAVQQQGIADVVERRAVLAGRQRAIGGAGDHLKCHQISFRAVWPHVPPGSAKPAPAAADRLPRPAMLKTSAQEMARR